MGRLSREGRAWSEAIVENSLERAALTSLHPDVVLSREEFLALAADAYGHALERLFYLARQPPLGDEGATTQPSTPRKEGDE